MRNYKITVNGNTYDVTVEGDGGGADVRTVSVPAPAPKAAAAPVQKPAPAPKAPAPAPKAAPAAPAAAGSGDVTMPLPGTVLSVNVSEGDQVKAGQVLIIFEAMKMENELMAPCDGTVKKLYAAKGQALETGAAVATIA